MSLGFRSLGFRSLEFRSLEFRSLEFRSLEVYARIRLFVIKLRTLNPKPSTLNTSNSALISTLIITLTSALSSPTTAQYLSTGDPLEIYLRTMLMEESGLTWNLRTPNSLTTLPEFSYTHPWQNRRVFGNDGLPAFHSEHFTIYAPSVLLTHNNERSPRLNLGPLWEGKGYNTLVTLGIGYERGPLKIAVRPSYVYNENEWYRENKAPKQPGLSSYAMSLLWIDAPQRFGEGAITHFDLGNSLLQLHHFGFRTGISNENIWIGPSLYNPLLLGNNAPGFLHAFLGSHKPYHTDIGEFEFYWYWGTLKESGFFDENPENDDRFTTGFTLNYSHPRIQGLNVGFARGAYAETGGGGLDVGDLFMAFKPASSREPLSDVEKTINDNVSMTSLFFRWHFPETGFEAYGEIGFQNMGRSIRDFLSEPELNRAYTIGLLKRFSLPRNMKMLLNTELTTLENSSISSQFREDRNSWYTNDHVRQGYTHRGRILGAGIGPGSSSQRIQLSLYHPIGMLGFSFNRIAWHQDRLFDNKEYFRSVQFRESARMHALHEIELRYGIYSILFLPWNLELQADVHFTSIDNLYQQHLFDAKNTNLKFTLRYSPARWSR